MIPTVNISVILLIGIVVGGHNTNAVTEILSVCGEDSVLRCMPKSVPDVQYRSLRWYKVSQESPPLLTGLLMKRLIPANSTTQLFGEVGRRVELAANDSLDLHLPAVTAQDTGMYRCFLSASIGQRNQEEDVYLKVTGCPNNESAYLTFDLYLILAIVLMAVALFTFCLSYACLRNLLLQRNSCKKKKKLNKPLLDSSLKKNVMVILTPGQGTPSYKHMFV